MERRQFTAEFKTKIAFTLLREEKPLGEIAAENNLSPNQLRNWKKEFLENATRVFAQSKQEKELRAKEKEIDAERNPVIVKIVVAFDQSSFVTPMFNQAKSSSRRSALARRNFCDLRSKSPFDPSGGISGSTVK